MLNIEPKDSYHERVRTAQLTFKEQEVLALCQTRMSCQQMSEDFDKLVEVC